MKQGKVWGETEEIFNNGIVSVNLLRIKKGGYCSEHIHERKASQFYILSGFLELTIWREKTIDVTQLCRGMGSMIPSGVWHKFSAESDTECLEIYYTELSQSDITRRIQGGLKDCS